MNPTVLRFKKQRTILLAIVGMYWFSQYVHMPYQTPYLLSLGVAASLVGTIVGAYGFSQLLLRLPVGLLADRRGQHKTFIIIGVIAVCSASLLRTFMPNALGFFLSNLLGGLASAMWISFMVLYSNYYAQHEMQTAMGKIIAVNNLGILFGFLVGTLFYDHMGMQFICAISSCIAFLAILLSLGIKEPETALTPPPVRELVKIYLDKKLIAFSLIALIQQGIQMATCMSFTSHIAEQKGAVGWEIGLCSIIYITTAALSSYFSSSKLAIKLGGRFWIPLIMLGLAIYCIIVPLAPSVEFIYLAQILAGISTGIAFPFCTSEAMQNVPLEKKSTAMGYFQAIYAIGMTFIPIFTGMIAGFRDITTGFFFLSFLAMLGVFGALWLYRKEKGPKVREQC